MKKHPIIVIKLGTSSIVDEKTHQPLLSTLSLIVETSVALRRDGYKVVLVSSGAIGMALREMNLPKRPKHLPKVQALASIGQLRLMALFDQLFDRVGQTVSQILLTRNDIADRTQYLNAQNTLAELLNMGVIPIVNENDTLSVSEIKFGDNDTLSAITAGMVQADYLFLMTDVDCLYDKNPRTHEDARPIEVVENISDLEVDASSSGSNLGTGGMGTKIVAARLATAAGVTTVITRSSNPGNVASIVNHVEGLKLAAQSNNAESSTDGASPGDGENTNMTSSVTSLASATSSRAGGEKEIPAAPPHTRFLPSPKPIGDRRFWLLHGLQPHGTIYIDPGACRALLDKAGLLPAGIVDVEGTFAQQECVKIVEVSRKQPPPPQSPSASEHLKTVQNQTWNSPAGLIRTNSGGLGALHSRSPSGAGSVAAVVPGSGPGSGSGSSGSPANDPSARDVARAVVNYSASEVRLIAGLKSTEIVSVLGYADSEYVALRENIAIVGAGERPPTPVPTGDSFVPAQGGVEAERTPGESGDGGMS
ncbi:MAG: hypothetical protein M1831_005215 [Alyxoria varia]|nr:MAG: hypothetical protein M1831_005215 [Alyxoria varia]